MVILKLIFIISLISLLLLPNHLSTLNLSGGASLSVNLPRTCPFLFHKLTSIINTPYSNLGKTRYW